MLSKMYVCVCVMWVTCTLCVTGCSVQCLFQTMGIWQGCPSLQSAEAGRTLWQSHVPVASASVAPHLHTHVYSELLRAQR